MFFSFILVEMNMKKNVYFDGFVNTSAPNNILKDIGRDGQKEKLIYRGCFSFKKIMCPKGLYIHIHM